MKRGLFGDESVKFEEDQDRPIRDHISRVAKACADRPADGLHVGAIMDRLDLIESAQVALTEPDTVLRRVHRLTDPLQLKRRWETLTELQRLKILRWVHLDMQLMDGEDSCRATASPASATSQLGERPSRRHTEPAPNLASAAAILTRYTEPPKQRNLWHLYSLADKRPAAIKDRIANGLQRANASRRGTRLYKAHGPSHRIWAISDLHVDVPQNMQYVHELESHPHDTLLVAGDLSQLYAHIEECLSALVAKFKHVFFVPGNHDLWLMRDEYNAGKTSIHKLLRVIELCDKLGVHTEPAYVSEHLLLVPLLSWYQPTFFPGEPDGVMRSFDSACRWPVWLQTGAKRAGDSEAGAAARPVDDGPSNSLDPAIADWFLQLNEPSLEFVRSELETTRSVSKDDSSVTRTVPIVITMSHFLPKPQLFARGFKAFGHVMGCLGLDEQIRSIESRVHVFGHSHVNLDERISGVRYVQQALGHPSEQDDLRLPALIWDSQWALSSASALRFLRPGPGAGAAPPRPQATTYSDGDHALTRPAVDPLAQV